MGQKHSAPVLTAAKTSWAILTPTNELDPEDGFRTCLGSESDRIQGKAPNPTEEERAGPPELGTFELSIQNQQYRETSYYTKYNGGKPSSNVSDSDCFTAAVVYPEYCESARSLMAHAIRKTATAAYGIDSSFANILNDVEQVQFGQQRAVDHSDLRRKIREFAVQTSGVAESHLNVAKSEITYETIMELLRNQWLVDQSDAFDSVMEAMREKFNVSNSEVKSVERFKSLISSIFGCSDDMVLEALAPVSSDWNRRSAGTFLRKAYRALFDSEFPRVSIGDKLALVSKVPLARTVLRNGMCSNGSFLFVLTTDLILQVYKLYKGAIDHLHKSFDMSHFPDIGSTSCLFCTQSRLIINTPSSQITTSITDLVSGKFQFVTDDKPNNETKRVVSNGVTHTTLDRSGIAKTWDSLSLKPLWETKMDLFDENVILSNGSFLMSICPEGNMLYWGNFNDKAKVGHIDFEGVTGRVQSGCMDIISDTIYLVDEKDGTSTLLAYHDRGSTDRALLKLDPMSSWGEYEQGLAAKLLWCHMSHFVFGKTIPENLLISEEHAEREMLKLTKLVVSSGELRVSHELVFSLIVLVDLNLHKYKSQAILDHVLDMVTRARADKVLHNISTMLLINHIDLFIECFKRSDVITMLMETLSVRNTREGQLYRDWLLRGLFYSRYMWKLALGADEIDIWIQPDWWNPVKPWKIGKLNFVLLFQENLVDETVRAVKEQEKYGTDSPVFEVVCKYAKLIFSRFRDVLRRDSRGVDSNSLSFILVSNFLMLLSPAMECVQLAQVIAEHLSSIMIELSRISSDDALVGRTV